MMKNYFPIGTVVLLKGGKKRIMIIGIGQKDIETNEVWDYSACLFPEGYIDPSKVILFNHEQVERVYAIGYQDSEQLEFLSKVNATMNDIKNKKTEENK